MGSDAMRRPRQSKREVSEIVLTRVPLPELHEKSTKLFALMNLAWDYVDTVLDLCLLYRVDGTKAHSRRIKACRRDYDSFRKCAVSGGSVQYFNSETERGLRFEELFKDDFRKLTFAISNRLSRLRIKGREAEIATAVMQSLALVRAVAGYSAVCDDMFRRYGLLLRPDSLVLDSFIDMVSELKRLAETLHVPGLDDNGLAAAIFVRRVRALRMSADGESFLPPENF